MRLHYCCNGFAKFRLQKIRRRTFYYVHNPKGSGVKTNLPIDGAEVKFMNVKSETSWVAQIFPY
jgi:hypothetical protein